MAEITAALVKELRETTGAGMMDAKKALTEVGGDMDAAIDWLRTKGLAKAAKKADRVAADGLGSPCGRARLPVALRVPDLGTEEIGIYTTRISACLA